MIIFREVSLKDLESVLTFMYEGEVNISNTSIHDFMRLAEALQVRGLTDAPNVSFY